MPSSRALAWAAAEMISAPCWVRTGSARIAEFEAILVYWNCLSVVKSVHVYVQGLVARSQFVVGCCKHMDEVVWAARTSQSADRGWGLLGVRSSLDGCST